MLKKAEEVIVLFAMIITDYYSMGETIGYIKRISQLKDGKKIKIIVVDNSTTKNGEKFLLKTKTCFERLEFNQHKVIKFKLDNLNVVLIEGNSNNGYAGGNNLGVQLSNFLYPEVKFFIFSNNDIYFDQELNLGEMKKVFIENDKVGILGPNIKSPGGEKQNPRKDMSFASQMIFWDINIMLCGCRFNRFFWNLDKEASSFKETGWVSGSFMVVRRDTFNLVGGFDTKTFLYAEEMILSQKFRNSGYMTFYYPDLTITHLHRGGAPSKQQRLWNHESKKYYYRNYKNVKEWKLKLSDVIFYILEFIHSIKHRNS